VRGADLILFCVKSTDTDAVARAIAPFVDADALVLSLQNGVENAATIARHVTATVVPVVVYVATAMPGPGVVRHYGRGDLVIGPLARDGAADAVLGRRLQDVVDFFASAAIAVRISADVMAELWAKLMVNCAYNAISGIAQASYGELAALAPVRELQHAVAGAQSRATSRIAGSNSATSTRSMDGTAASQPAVLPVPSPITKALCGSGCSRAPISPPMIWVGASPRALPSLFPATRKA
jgi:2-dehydropantoate 2-reductase